MRLTSFASNIFNINTFRYCMVYEWSILRYMPSLCSVDILKRIYTSPVTPIPAYRMRTMSVAYWPSLKTCLNPPRGTGEKRIGTLASEDDETWQWRVFGHIQTNNRTSETLYTLTVINKYCKRGYFRWGKISRKYGKDISIGGNFHYTTRISLIKSYGFNFRAGENFAKKAISRKTRKLPPRENFHVYSMGNLIWIDYQVGIAYWNILVTYNKPKSQKQTFLYPQLKNNLAQKQIKSAKTKTDLCY